MNREKLNEVLKTICKNVYYQPPVDMQISYPCFVYTKNYTEVKNANNKSYIKHHSWNITYITRKPDDSKEDEMLEAFDHIKLTNNNIIDGLYQEIYRIYY